MDFLPVFKILENYLRRDADTYKNVITDIDGEMKFFEKNMVIYSRLPTIFIFFMCFMCGI
jgi:hypothetical protein